MVISKRRFNLLCAEYQLSPTQRRIAALLLEGKTTNFEICRELHKRERNVQKQVHKMAQKMFCRNRTDILWRFVADARSGD